jgi:hypothetical protein
MTARLSPQEAASQLSAVSAELAAALADEASAPLAPVMLLDRACGLVDRLSWAMCREPAAAGAGGLAEIARCLAAELQDDSRTASAAEDSLSLQAQAVGAQAADLAAAYRWWAARGCRPGTARGLVESEVAAMLLTVAVFAELAGIDIDKAVGRQVTLARLPDADARAAQAAGLALAVAEACPEHLS